MSLSERRKKLLIFLILCLIVVGVFIFIIGKNNKTEAVAYSLCPGCGEGTYTSPTCVSKGSCYVCGYTKPATGHSFPVFQTCEGAVFCSKCGYRKEGPGHNWKDADCENPKTCLTCGKIEGTAKGHDFSGTCAVDPEQPTRHIIKCSRSGCTAVKINNHNYIESCTKNKYCPECGYEAPASALGHNYEIDEYSSANHVWMCTRCYNKYTEAHDLQKADCTRNTHCSICNYEIPDTAIGHSFSLVAGVDSTHHIMKCSMCDATKREEHNFTPATCTTPATCKICEVAHNGSALGPHNWGTDGKCTVCGETKTPGGNPGGNPGGGGGRKSNNL